MQRECLRPSKPGGTRLRHAPLVQERTIIFERDNRGQGKRRRNDFLASSIFGRILFLLQLHVANFLHLYMRVRTLRNSCYQSIQTRSGTKYDMRNKARSGASWVVDPSLASSHLSSLKKIGQLIVPNSANHAKRIQMRIRQRWQPSYSVAKSDNPLWSFNKLGGKEAADTASR